MLDNSTQLVKSAHIMSLCQQVLMCGDLKKYRPFIIADEWIFQHKFVDTRQISIYY